MSHAKERTEKNCLNCNAVVAGRWCQICGQENIETRETFGHLAGHFISDIFHFDGQFFSTAKYLLFKPGFLTYEYVRGRRASYLNPIKMYFFVSAVFFLFFLSVYKPEVSLNGGEKGNLTAKQTGERLQVIRIGLQKMIAEKDLPAVTKDMVKRKLDLVDKNMNLLQKDSTRKKELLDEVESTFITNLGSVTISDSGFHTVKEYEKAQAALPEARRDGWLKRRFMERNIEIGNEFKENRNETSNLLLESFFHRFPQALFVSLPLFAGLLQLLYVRRRKFYYANHAIYTVHLYCALFVFMFVLMILGKAELVPYVSWLSWLRIAAILYAVYYTYGAMYVYYGQSVGKTLVKWLILNIVSFIMLTLILLLLFLFSFYTL